MNLRRAVCARLAAALCLIAAAPSARPVFADEPGALVGLGEASNEHGDEGLGVAGPFPPQVNEAARPGSNQPSSELTDEITQLPIATDREVGVNTAEDKSVFVADVPMADTTQIAESVAPDPQREAKPGSSNALIDLPNVFAPAGAVGHSGSLLIAVSTVSYHTHDSDELNAVNPGIGVGYALSRGIDILAGTFKNSYSEQSRYAMLRARINDGADPVAIHVCGGYLDGYVDSKGESVFPLAMALDVQYGPLILLAAPAQRHGGLTLSLWFLFDGGRWLGKWL